MITLNTPLLKEMPLRPTQTPLIALVNARATTWHYRLPLAIMAIGASLEGKYSYEIFDGNIDRDLRNTLLAAIGRGGLRYVAFTVMPGLQLTGSILLAKAIRERFPTVRIIWGGYFPTLHTQVVLGSGYVDFVIRNQGDHSFVRLIEALERGSDLSCIKGLSFGSGDTTEAGIHVSGDPAGTGGPDKDGGRSAKESVISHGTERPSNAMTRHNEPQELIDPNLLPPLPYHKVPVERYIERTYVGSRTINYHSSAGCPFTCGFCAVAAVYEGRWRGLTAERIAADLRWFKKRFGVNAVEFHDNNFFTSERRTLEFAERIHGEGISWWGEGRPDTLLAYREQTWKAMKAGGCRMIFYGAESSSASTLQLMNKGGTQTPDTVLELASRSRDYGIVPEFSFVLGSPTGHVDEDLDRDFAYIRRIKQINPQSEIILYVYSPVHFEEADLYRAAESHAFSYPRTLDEWLKPEWAMHDLRKNPVTPWLTPAHIARIKNFERVLNARYPTNSDLKLTPFHRQMLRALGSWRYRFGIYTAPYEIAAVQRFLRYRQPEIEGF